MTKKFSFHVALDRALLHAIEAEELSQVTMHFNAIVKSNYRFAMHEAHNLQAAPEEPIAEYRERVSHPGKFEGEPVYTPYYWDYVLDGCGEDLDCDEGENLQTKFEITDAERVRFDGMIPDDAKSIVLWETDQGFVCHHLIHWTQPGWGRK